MFELLSLVFLSLTAIGVVLVVVYAIVLIFWKKGIQRYVNDPEIFQLIAETWGGCYLITLLLLWVYG